MVSAHNMDQAIDIYADIMEPTEGLMLNRIGGFFATAISVHQWNVYVYIWTIIGKYITSHPELPSPNY